MKWIRKYVKFLSGMYKTKYNKSYSQSGEDMILGTLFAGLKHGVYVDVGANDPYFQSNTHFFYKKKWHGINIDANEDSIRRLKVVRKNDINIEALISDSMKEMEYFCYESSAYNGCIKRDYVPSKLLYSKKIQAVTLTSILAKLEIDKINFLSIDVEGLDLMVLKSLDLDEYRPEVILIESFSKDIITDLNSDISKFLISKGYVYYCRSVTNSFYLSSDFFRNRFR